MAEADVAFNALRQLIDELGISLDLPHLDEALTHPSYANELGAGQRDNQRLEFLGDAVLGVCVSELLMEAFEEVDEGQLTLMRASLVNTLALAQRAKQLGLAETLMVGRGADAAGERYRTNVLADALEALVGAVYLDAGLHGARLLTREVVGEQLATLVHDGGMVRDAKSRLQERLQAVGSAPPTYEVVSAEGPAHARQFTVRVVVPRAADMAPIAAEGVGRSKKIAEQRAACAALDVLGD